MRTRKQLVEAFKEGRTVIFDGVHYMKVEDLPSEAQMAKGNKEQENLVKAELAAEVARLQEELALLNDTKEVPAEEVKKVEEKVPEKVAEKAPKDNK